MLLFWRLKSTLGDQADVAVRNTKWRTEVVDEQVQCLADFIVRGH